jgi:hypothetical protein
MKQNALPLALTGLLMVTGMACSEESKSKKGSSGAAAEEQALTISDLAGVWLIGECKEIATPADAKTQTAASTTYYKIKLAVAEDGRYATELIQYQDKTCTQAYTLDGVLANVIKQRTDSNQAQIATSGPEKAAQFFGDLYRKGDSAELRTLLGDAVYLNEKAIRDKVALILNQMFNNKQTGTFVVGEETSDGAVAVDIKHDKTGNKEAYTEYKSVLIKDERLYFSADTCQPSDINTQDPSSPCKAPIGHTPEARTTTIDQTSFWLRAAE